MKINIYVIYDSKARVYNKPFYQINHEICHRTCTDILSQPNDIAKHPEDFTVFHLGAYDDESAMFHLLDTPVSLFRFHELQAVLPI